MIEIITTRDGNDNHYHTGCIDGNGNGETSGTFLQLDDGTIKAIPTHPHNIKSNTIEMGGMYPHVHVAYRKQQVEGQKPVSEKYIYGYK